MRALAYHVTLMLLACTSEATETAKICYLYSDSRQSKSPILWIKKGKWTIEAADTLLNVTKSVFGEPSLNYLKGYVAITVDGNNYMWLHRRTSNKSLLVFRIAQSLQDEAVALLDGKNIAYVRKTKTIRITVDREMIEREAQLFKNIAELVKKSWKAS